jgi:hypothetical protein
MSLGGNKKGVEKETLGKGRRERGDNGEGEQRGVTQ